MELMSGKIFGFIMVLTRISALFLVLPIFNWTSIPARVKLAMTVLLAIFFSMIVPVSVGTKQLSVLKAILLISNEGVYGLSLGLVAIIVFSAIKLGGRIIEQQMGLDIAQVLDPSTGEEDQLLGTLLEIIFIILFLAANGHHLLLTIISRSYEAFPSGSIPTITVLTDGIVKAGSVLLLASIRLAAPMLAAFLLLMVILAVLARIVPEMDILFMSFPVRIGLGLFMLAIFLPLINGFITEFADWMGKLLPL